MPHEYIQNTLEYVVQKSTSSVVRALYDIDTRFLFWVSDRNRRDKSEFLYKVKKKKKKKASAVSTTVWMVETQLCKLRGTSDTFV